MKSSSPCKPFSKVKANWKSFYICLQSDSDGILFYLEVFVESSTEQWMLNRLNLCCSRKSHPRAGEVFSEILRWTVVAEWRTITNRKLPFMMTTDVFHCINSVRVWAGRKRELESHDKAEDRIINDWSIRNVPVHWWSSVRITLSQVPVLSTWWNFPFNKRSCSSKLWTCLRNSPVVSV